MNKKILEVKNLAFSYKESLRPLIEDISLKIRPGERLAVIGENGAGKTTLMKLICGLYEKDQGQILVAGQDIASYKSHELSKKVAYVFQNPDDQIFMSKVEDEIFYGRKDKDRLLESKRLKDILKLTGLEDELDNHPHNLPWSFRKFVAIATIMLQNPDLLIFDEPTAGQDQEGKRRLEAIFSYLENQGKALITISHDMDFVAKNFKRVLVMKDGHILQDKEAQEIFYQGELMKSASLKKPYVPYILEDLGEDLPKILEIDQIKHLLKKGS